MVFVAYMDCSYQMGSRIYFVCLVSLLCFGIAMAFNYYYLIPRFLLKGRYTVYLLYMSATAYLLPTLSTLQEYGFRTLWVLPHRITSYTNPLILVDNLSSCMLLFICFISISAIALFREWKIQDEYLSLMESEHLRSEVNKLKGQVTPSFLSKTLIKASGYIQTAPRKATEMLLQLGQLLRYQLYDCNRDYVLLTSEIHFLRIFLQTEQMSREIFSYEIRTEGNLNVIQTPPLLFISLVQYLVQESTTLSIAFSSDDRILSFRCESDSRSLLPDQEIEWLRRRLDLHYAGKYTFSQGARTIEINIEWL